MDNNGLLQQLFRSEYNKIVSVLCHRFGIEHIENAEDIVSETFLAASEHWELRGIPENPAAWLFTVAKNKTRNLLKRHSLFEQKLTPELKAGQPLYEDMAEIDLSEKNISDSQLAMIFVVCDPVNPVDVQVALALNLLCGFDVQEIADAFLSGREVIYKRIQRGKLKLKEAGIRVEPPGKQQIADRKKAVLTTLYLLFSEGYYSASKHVTLRKDFCQEAMRLAYLLVSHERTNGPEVNALLSLMCFHASRFGARTNEQGELVLYQDQDESLWDMALLEKGAYFLGQAASGEQLSKYHLEAGIAYWHTQKQDTREKWENILQLYNQLLILEYSPVAALNRTFALGKARGKEEAIAEAEKLGLTDNHFYHTLLGHLHTGTDNDLAIAHFKKALAIARSNNDRQLILKNIEAVTSR